jgi:flagellar biosynthesis/type III secretory pathway chaperone
MKEQQQYIPLLLQTLEKQVVVLQDVLKVTKEQSTMADSPNFDEVMLEKSLNQKDVLISKLNSLDDGFAAVYSKVRREITEHPERYREEVRKMQNLIKQCTDLGVEIQVLEERNRDRFSKSFADKHKQYSMKKTAATVASKYHRTMHPGMRSGTRFSS